MAIVTVRVDGLQDLLQRMRDLNSKTKRKFIRSGALAGANVIKKAVQQRAPVRTGELKAAISTRRSRKFSDTAKGYEQRDVGIFKVRGGKYANTARNRRLGRVGKTFEVDPPSYYWRFLEFGTVRMAPHPFMRPGFDQSKQQAANATIAKLRKDIEGTGR